MSRKLARLALVIALVGSVNVVVAPVPATAGLPPTEWVIGPRIPIAMLTFDGPARYKRMVSIMDVLKEKGAPASFFLPGSWIRSHPKLVKEMRRAGHLVANRGWSGRSFTDMTADEIRASIGRARAALKKVGVFTAPFVAAPRGERDERVLRAIGAAGYRSVRWTFRAGGGSAKTVKRAVVRHAQRGAILALDPGKTSHRRALRGIVTRLRKDKGLGLRTIAPLRDAHPIRYDVTVKSGSSGSEVLFLQRILRRIGYPAGAKDGKFGYATLQAVYAFEKVRRMTRDGVVPPYQMAAIAKAGRPPAPKREPKNFVDVDISRQVLFEVRDRKVRRILPVSTGNEEYYTSDGEQRRAHTPRGNFVVERKIQGERHSDLGVLYDPNYFVGGYAIHGSPSVPVYPASHGCVRIPMYQSRPFFNRTPIGMPVFVHD
jgi:peptidoglycan/xylan/chitin deacetylase (PgdA/CDA1 family)/lipoprotein-anchoring transpeptidase ErfK/SrfK